MKQTMKKCLTLLLALALLFTMAVPAAAATPYDKTITFTDVAQGDTVKAYKLVGYNADYTEYAYHADFKGFIDTHIPTASSTEDKLKNLSSTEMAAFLAWYVNACQIPGAIGGHALPAASATATADTSNQAKLTLEPGYYVVLGSTTATNDRTYQLTSVFVQVKNGEAKVIATNGKTEIADGKVQLKHTTGPIISMSVKDDSGTAAAWKGAAAGQVGEVLDFYIHLELPNYNNDNVYMTKLELTDTMHGLKYEEGSAKLTTTAPYGETGAVEKTTGLTSTPGTYDANGNQTVTFNVDYHEIKTIGAPVSAYIHFKAKVMPEAAAAGKTATAETKLDYTFSLEPNTFRTTSAVGVKVHTYAFSLAKTSDEDIEGSTGKKPLTNAGFTLYTDAEMTTANAVSMIKETDGGETYYRPALAGETGVTDLLADMGADQNTLLVRGLDAATYYLKETKVPSGYYAPKGGFKVQLTGDRDVETLNGNLAAAAASSFTAINATDSALITGTASVNGTEMNRLDASLKNSSTPVLPTTGGVGTVMFTVVGLLCMGAALWFFLFARRRRKDEQEQG
mgnify:CR=1 FL=1